MIIQNIQTKTSNNHYNSSMKFIGFIFVELLLLNELFFIKKMSKVNFDEHLIFKDNQSNKKNYLLKDR